MPHAFSERLAEGPLLCDGAMGTVLYARGVPLDACFDVLNLNNPRVVQAVHADYVAAGADAIETNTFGANRFKLGVHGVEAQLREINRRGVRLARDVRESAGRDVWVLGSIGPLGKYLEPLGTVTAVEGREAFREQAEALLEGGVDAFVVETFSDLAEIALAVEAIRAITDLPVIAQMAFTDEGVTFMGRSPADVARTLRALGVQALGANCSVGSSTLYDVLERMVAEAGGLPLAIQPNAGLPSRIDERLIYLSSPGYMADYAGRMVEAGARLVGGCCGTTPQHTAAMRETLDRLLPGPRRVMARAPVTARPAAVETPGLARTLPPTPLARKLQAREFVVTVELDPPRGHTVDKLVQGAKLLKEKGVEIVDINDGSLGRVRMSVLATALLIRDHTGLDVNMHFTCRDRNLMGIQADLLGAHALDIRNILAMTGDPPRTGDYANATAVFDVDGVGLIGILRRMNEGLDATGSSIGDPTGFCIGAALNPAAEDPDHEIERMHRKIEAGASWLQTQPVYDLEALERFLARAGRIPVPVLVGILPLHSFRHAEFLHNEVPGITVPDRAPDAAVRPGATLGPLHGVPIGVKDIIDVAGMPTTAGARAFAHTRPTRDATCVARLRAAGAIVLGKTHTTQFAYRDPAPTTNPWNAAHTPGGSSSGSAAAVAARTVPVALGSQTVGSILRPAAYNGIVGLKGTNGLIPLDGVVPLGYSLDHVGPLTRSVEDAALVLRTMAGRALTPEPIETPRLAVARELFERAEPELRRHLDGVVDRLVKAGARIEEVRLPPSFAGLADAALVLLEVEAAT